MALIDDLIKAMKDTTTLANLPGAAPKGPAPVPAAPPSGSQEPGMLERFKTGVGNLGYGALKGAADIAQAPVQLLAHEYKWMNDHAWNPSWGPFYAQNNAIRQKIDGTVGQLDDYLKNQEDQYQGDTKGSWAAGTGRFASSALPFIMGDFAAAPGAASGVAANVARATLPQAMRSGALGGALQSAVSHPISNVDQDPDGGDDYWSKKAASTALSSAFGGALPVLTRGAGNLIQQIRGVAQPIKNPDSMAAPVVAGAGGSDPAAIAKALESYPDLVPGVKPTTAQVLQTPGASMVEKTVTGTDAGKLAMLQRQVANNAARLDYAKQFAGTREAIDAATDARDAVAQPMLDKLSAADPVDAAPILDQLDQLGSSGTTQAVKQAAQAIRQTVVDKAVPQNPAGAPGLLDAGGNPMSSLASDGKSLMIRPDDLNGIVQDLPAMVGQAASDWSTKAAIHDAIGHVKDAAVNQLESAVPGYRDFLSGHDASSVPINTMNLFNKLTDNLENGTGATGGLPKMTLEGVQKTAAGNDPGLPIAPNAQEALENLTADLKREAGGSGGDIPASSTIPQLAPTSWLASQLFGKDFNGTSADAIKAGTLAGSGAGAAIGNQIGHDVGGAMAGSAVGGLAAQKLWQTGKDNVTQALLDAILNPDRAADLMKRYDSLTAKPFLLQALDNPPPVTPIDTGADGDNSGGNNHADDDR